MNFELLEFLLLDDNLIKNLADLAKKDKVGILRLSEKLYKGNVSCLVGKSPLVKLAVVLKSAEKTRLKYNQKGISDDIFKSTFGDIKIWCENCDNRGLENINWIKNHINFELFRLGRLQFQIFTCSNPALNYSKLPFNRAEKVVYIHIPQGEKLDFDECIDSLKMADEFFRKYFPDYNYKYYFCESWLIFENNREFMAENSNIVKFMSLFDIHYSVNAETQAFERIFGKDINNNSLIYKLNKNKRKSDINSLQEFTSLQKSAKYYLQSGNKLGIGIGTIPKGKY